MPDPNDHTDRFTCTVALDAVITRGAVVSAYWEGDTLRVVVDTSGVDTPGDCPVEIDLEDATVYQRPEATDTRLADLAASWERQIDAWDGMGQTDENVSATSEEIEADAIAVTLRECLAELRAALAPIGRKATP